MRMICQVCHAESDGRFCPECGARTVPIDDSLPLNVKIGDRANILGGIHSSTADSHNVHNESHVVNHVTNFTAYKSEKEALLEKKNIYLLECRRALEDNKLDSKDEIALEECRLRLGLDITTAKSILDDIRLLSDNVSRKTSLNPIVKTKLKILSDNLLNNNVSELMEQIDDLEAFVNKFEHDELSRKYFLALAVLNPHKCIKLKESSQIDSYWKSYWSYIAYIKEGIKDSAAELLASMDRFTEYPEDNLTILALSGAIMLGNASEAKELLDAVTGEYTHELQKLVDSIYLILDPRQAQNIGVKESECAFYLANMFGHKIHKVQVVGKSSQVTELYKIKSEDQFSEDSRPDSEGIKARPIAETFKKDFATQNNVEENNSIDNSKSIRLKDKKKTSARKEPSDEDKRQIIALWDGGNHEQAINLAKKWKYSEDSVVLNFIANAYNYGLAGYKKDNKMALDLWVKSADLGFDRAQYNLGYSYLNGINGVDIDFQKAFNYSSLAAKQNYVGGKYNLAFFYLKGLNGIKVDTVKGLSLLKECADTGYLPSILELGKIYVYGNYNVCVDYSRGYKYIKTAALDFKEPIAICTLAEFYNSAFNYGVVKPNDKIAVKYYKEAANLGYDFAQYYVGCSYAYGWFGLPIDYKKAKELLLKSATQGCDEANEELKKLKFISVSPTDSLSVGEVSTKSKQSNNDTKKQSCAKGKVVISDVTFSIDKNFLNIKASITINSARNALYYIDVYNGSSYNRLDWEPSELIGGYNDVSNKYYVRSHNNLLEYPISTGSPLNNIIVVKDSQKACCPFAACVDLNDILDHDGEREYDFHIVIIHKRSYRVVSDKCIPYQIKSSKPLIGSRKWEFQFRYEEKF